jgi:hypothetical protein
MTLLILLAVDYILAGLWLRGVLSQRRNASERLRKALR